MQRSIISKYLSSLQLQWDQDASDSHLRQNVFENREQVFKSGFLHWILMINNNNVLFYLNVLNICAMDQFQHNAAHSEETI